MITGAEPLISLPAANVDRAVRFYTETLGMSVAMGNAERGFYVFGGTEALPTAFGIHRSTVEAPPTDRQDVWVWLAVDDVNTARSTLAERGVRLVGDVTPRGPGLEQAFVDSEGNVVRLWSRMKELRRSVDINASPADVFELLSNAQHFGGWFAAVDGVELEPRLGGRVSFVDPLFGRVSGRVVAFEQDARITFEFSENWPARLDIVVAPKVGGTRVEVHQSGFEVLATRDYGIPGLIERLDAGLNRLPAAI